MTTPPIPTSSRVDKACSRLERAVAEVEAALEARASAAGVGGAEVEALKAELAERRARNEALVDATEAVSQRLDRVIGRLKSVLKE